MKLTPNILCKASTCADPKSTKKTDNLTAFFELLGSVHIKALRKMLVKLTPEIDIIGTIKRFRGQSNNK